MASEITEGFDEAFGRIGLGYDEMVKMNETAKTISEALYELDEIMREKKLYEKYPLQDEFGRDGNVFDEYNKTAKEIAQQEITTIADIGSQLEEASLRAVTEVIHETIGNEYGIEVSYSNEAAKVMSPRS